MDGEGELEGELEGKWKANGRQMEDKWKANGRQLEGSKQMRDEYTSELQPADYTDYMRTDTVIHTKSMQSAHHLPELTLYIDNHISSSCGSAPGWMTMYIVYGQPSYWVCLSYLPLFPPQLILISSRV